MSETKLTKQELEELGYYDFSAYMGVPYFHWGGIKATDRLLELLKLDSKKNLLVVGCGTGYTACYIADNYNCHVKGIDIAEHMVSKANERAVDMGLTDRVDFQIGDAYKLPFKDHMFDSVMTEFVTLFLEREKVLKEYLRVLQPGGAVGVNELFKEEEIPGDIETALTKAIEGWEEAVGLPFNLTSQKEWQRSFKQAGFIDIKSERVDSTYSWGEYSKALGGRVKTTKVVFRVLYYLLTSKKMRKKFMPIGRVKKLILRNKRTRDYFGAMLCVGQKPIL